MRAERGEGGEMRECKAEGCAPRAGHSRGHLWGSRGVLLCAERRPREREREQREAGRGIGCQRSVSYNGQQVSHGFSSNPGDACRGWHVLCVLLEGT